MESGDLRNQFLSNAYPKSGGSRDNLRNNNNFVTDEDDNSLVFENTYSTASYPISEPQSSKSKKWDAPNDKSNEYELHKLDESPTYNNPLEDPFNPRQGHQRGPYGYRQSSNTNPFEDQNLNDSHENPFEPKKSQPSVPLDDEYERIRRNEKARLRQLRRKPRFHYTRLPYFTMLVTIIQVAVFIAELGKMASLTGSAFQTKPYFNPMLGPSTYLMINMGARYTPCMQSIEGITNDTSVNYPCPNSTNTDTNVCSLSELCGLSGIPSNDGSYQPHQWYRIITPIFLHAGFLHIIFNLLLQVTMGSTIERNIGFIKFFIIYLMSGISGFLLGANFSPNGIASTGASGALFGIVATNIIMFVYCGRKNTNMYGTKRYKLFIFIMILEILISLVLGLLPGLDNFSHIGGFAMGMLMAILLLPDPHFIYADGIITYHSRDNTLQQFKNNWNPRHNWEDKIASRVYMWIAVRILCLILAIVYIALLIKNFFGNKENPQDNNCSWCKYINCIPVNGWCEIGEVQIETSNSSKPKRSSEEDWVYSGIYTPELLVKDNLGEFTIMNRNILDDRLQITSADSFIQAQHSGIGLVFYFIIGLITFKFCKSKKWI